MGKGVSPLIASVLLLAVTLSVASIFSGWGPSLANFVTEETRNHTEQTIDCNRADVKIVSAKYYSSDSETSIVLRNKGNSDLDDLQASAWHDDLPMNDTVISLVSGNFTTVNITTHSKPHTVKAFSRDCTSVTDKHENIKE